MLPALLAGAGILAVAALFIFGDSDEAKQADKDTQVNSASANTKTQPKGSMTARKVDGADQTARVQPKLNPRIAEAVVTEGMAPTPNKPPVPESFPSKDAEIEYWEKELEKASSLLESRQKSQDRIPKMEEKMQGASADEIEVFERRKQIVADNLARAQERVAEIEEKLIALRS